MDRVIEEVGKAQCLIHVKKGFHFDWRAVDEDDGASYVAYLFFRSPHRTAV